MKPSSDIARFAETGMHGIIPHMQIDHVLIAASDLDAAAARLEAEHGLSATGGGRHEGIGTRNRIVPLGRGYLELITVEDPGEAAASPLGAALAERIEAVGDGLMGWAVAVPDVSAHAARVGAELSAIARQGLTASLAGVATAMTEPYLPFFIQRDPGVADPSAAGDYGGLTWIEVAGDPDRLAGWLGRGHGLPLRVVDGPPGVTAVGIGDRELR
jgi:hypothetical protein